MSDFALLKPYAFLEFVVSVDANNCWTSLGHSVVTELSSFPGISTMLPRRLGPKEVCCMYLRKNSEMPGLRQPVGTARRPLTQCHYVCLALTWRGLEIRHRNTHTHEHSNQGVCARLRRYFVRAMPSCPRLDRA